MASLVDHESHALWDVDREGKQPKTHDSVGASDSGGVLGMTRRSLHVEPRGLLQIARHYVRELIYGANDGIITTFAVVAGVAGGGLSLRAVLIVGAANLFADGLSMAVRQLSLHPLI
jgi:hypothetical protein